jgi:hypothetical protein
MWLNATPLAFEAAGSSAAAASGAGGVDGLGARAQGRGLEGAEDVDVVSCPELSETRRSRVYQK